MTIEDKLNALVDTLVTRETHKGAVNRVRIRAKSQLTALLNEAKKSEHKLVMDRYKELQTKGEVPILMLIVANRIAELDSMRNQESKREGGSDA